MVLEETGRVGMTFIGRVLKKYFQVRSKFSGKE